MADGDPMPDIHGHSLWPLLTGRGAGDHPNETFSEHLGIERTPSRMIRTGPWKCYTYHDDTAPVLYNLEDDPDELHNLGSDPNYEPIRDRLLSRIFEHWDPEYVLRESANADRDIRLITRWGQAIQPTLPDSVPVPDDAEDIECR